VLQHCHQVCSRNARLTAIRSFFHVVALRDPGSIGVVDYTLLLTMYNSGARLSEMTCMQRGQVKFDSTTYLQLCRRDVRKESSLCGQRPAVFFETGFENVKSRQRRWHFLRCEGRRSRAMALTTSCNRRLGVPLTYHVQALSKFLSWRQVGARHAIR
jgi:hypothetical protein